MCWCVNAYYYHSKLIVKIKAIISYNVKKSHTLNAAAKSLQSCPTLSDPMDCSPPGSCVHGIFQARVLEWGAIALSVRGSYCPKKE